MRSSSKKKACFTASSARSADRVDRCRNIEGEGESVLMGGKGKKKGTFATGLRKRGASSFARGRNSEKSSYPMVKAGDTG